MSARSLPLLAISTPTEVPRAKRPRAVPRKKFLCTLTVLPYTKQLNLKLEDTSNNSLIGVDSVQNLYVDHLLPWLDSVLYVISTTSMHVKETGYVNMDPLAAEISCCWYVFSRYELLGDAAERTRTVPLVFATSADDAETARAQEANGEHIWAFLHSMDAIPATPDPRLP